MYLKKTNQQKKLDKNSFFFVAVLKVKDENSRTWIRIRIHWLEHESADPGPDQNITDLQHCCYVITSFCFCYPSC